MSLAKTLEKSKVKSKKSKKLCGNSASPVLRGEKLFRAKTQKGIKEDGQKSRGLKKTKALFAALSRRCEKKSKVKIQNLCGNSTSLILRGEKLFRAKTQKGIKEDGQKSRGLKKTKALFAASSRRCEKKSKVKIQKLCGNSASPVLRGEKKINMKHLTTFLSIFAASILLFSCTKKSDDVAGCEETETTKVTFKNTRTTSVKLEVAITFNAQFVPNSPVIQIDLAPGASTVREFRYGRYFIEWENGCPAACSQGAFYAKTFEQCGEYEVSF